MADNMSLRFTHSGCEGELRGLVRMLGRFLLEDLVLSFPCVADTLGRRGWLSSSHPSTQRTTPEHMDLRAHTL